MLPTGPFVTSPDPRFFYQTEAIREAAEKIRYVIDNRQGLTVLYGDVGMGKSTLVRFLWAEYLARPDSTAIMIPNADVDTDLKLLKLITDEFGVQRKRAKIDQQKALNEFLGNEFVEGRNCVIFLDEAQVFPGRVLELIRGLLNFETDTAKLVQVVLSGQLELRTKLRDPSKRGLRSRIFTSSVLAPLSLEGTREMIGYRLERAKEPNPFRPDAIEAVYRWTRGTPRDILKVCGIAFDTARALGTDVDAGLVDRIAPDAEIEDHE